MKIVLAALYNPNIFPALYYTACILAGKGHDVFFLSRIEPCINMVIDEKSRPKWIKLNEPSVIEAKIPFVRGNYHRVLKNAFRVSPDIFIGQHQLALVGILYSLFCPRVKVIPYFCDHIIDKWYSPILKIFAGRFDAYIDICDLRVSWREKDWPRMTCQKFVIRQAPPLSINQPLDQHFGIPRVVFTGTDFGKDMQWELLSEFISHLCENGVEFHWYLPGTESVRSKARLITSNSNFFVCSAVDKNRLLQILPSFDAGLLWAPIDSKNKVPKTLFEHNLWSAASNKICEYHAAGLLAIHTGNPGLNYLPDTLSYAIDPWQPQRSAFNLAEFLKNQDSLGNARGAALEYCRTEMNAEAQVLPLVKFLQNI